MKLNLFLAQPFRFLSTAKGKWVYILSSAGFAIFFLALFQPYGLTEEIHNPVNSRTEIGVFLLSVSVVAFCGLSLSQFVLRPLFNFRKVTIRQYCKWYAFEILIVTLINLGVSFLIPDLGDDFEKELNVFFQLNIYAQSFITLLFPFFGTIGYEFIQKLNDEIKILEEQIKNYHAQYTASHKGENLSVKDENGNLALVLKLEDFLYAESGNQYVLMHYLEDGELKREIVRNRLKNILRQVDKLPIKRCHRSYIVNLLQVKTMQRTEKKYFLILKKLKSNKIPISKSYLEEIKREIREKT